MVPKWGPNRIFDAEALRDPLEDLLERSWTLLEPKKVNLESLLAALGKLLVPLIAPQTPRLNLSKWWDRKAQLEASACVMLYGEISA